MALSKRKKTLIWIVLGVYAVFVVAFLIKTITMGPPPTRDAWVKGLVAASEELAGEGEAPFTPREAGEIFDRYIAEKGQIIGLNYTMFMMMLNFAVFVLALYSFLWDPMITFLDERRKAVRGDLDSARSERESAEASLKEANQTLHEARQNRMTLRDRARREAQAERQRILDKAREDADRLMDETRQRLDAEVGEARANLRREVGDLAVGIAARLLERELQMDDHKRMVNDFIAELGSSEGSDGLGRTSG